LLAIKTAEYLVSSKIYYIENRNNQPSRKWIASLLNVVFPIVAIIWNQHSSYWIIYLCDKNVSIYFDMFVLAQLPAIIQ